MIAVDDYGPALLQWASGMVGNPSAWGESDCICLGIQAVDIITGADHFTTWRGRWADEASALEYLADHSPVDWLDEIGARPVSPNFAGMGCVFLLPWAGASGTPLAAAYVCLGARSLSATPGGLVELVPTRAVRSRDGARAWGVS